MEITTCVTVLSCSRDRSSVDAKPHCALIINEHNTIKVLYKVKWIWFSDQCNILPPSRQLHPQGLGLYYQPKIVDLMILIIRLAFNFYC